LPTTMHSQEVVLYELMYEVIKWVSFMRWSRLCFSHDVYQVFGSFPSYMGIKKSCEVCKFKCSPHSVGPFPRFQIVIVVFFLWQGCLPFPAVVLWRMELN
jgi:hypothetical protein